MEEKHYPVYFKDGVLFANNYIRIVSGGRGNYMELSKDQISVELISKFNQKLPESVPNGEPFFYYWLTPIGRSEKIYWQIKLVDYADYKIGLYYIHPSLVNFSKKEECEKNRQLQSNNLF